MESTEWLSLSVPQSLSLVKSITSSIKALLENSLVCWRVCVLFIICPYWLPQPNHFTWWLAPIDQMPLLCVLGMKALVSRFPINFFYRESDEDDNVPIRHNKTHLHTPISILCILEQFHCTILFLYSHSPFCTRSAISLLGHANHRQFVHSWFILLSHSYKTGIITIMTPFGEGVVVLLSGREVMGARWSVWGYLVQMRPLRNWLHNKAFFIHPLLMD